MIELPLTHEQRAYLRHEVGVKMRDRYRREVRLNLTGDDRPFEDRKRNRARARLRHGS